VLGLGGEKQSTAKQHCQGEGKTLEPITPSFRMYNRATFGCVIHVTSPLLEAGRTTTHFLSMTPRMTILKAPINPGFRRDYAANFA
ncbi:hypothetical protein, partial [Rhodospirillum rubrum]|uniref:hypothetical protein n=1 Tax=Rhodospirillum rubrum TaxID=1085 RepID=UPI0028AB8582